MVRAARGDVRGAFGADGMVRERCGTLKIFAAGCAGGRVAEVGLRWNVECVGTGGPTGAVIDDHFSCFE